MVHRQLAPALACLLCVWLIVSACARSAGQMSPPAPTGPAEPVLPLHKRDARFNDWLTTRFDTILPEIMRREQIDMWIVICREHNEDPVYTTLVPHPSMFAWRLTMFVYFDRGAAGIERLTVNRYGGGDLHKEFPNYYQSAWEPETIDSWQRLAQIVTSRNPKTIGVNTSDTWAFADGLSAANRAQLVRVLGPEYAKRLVSAERLVVGWLERRSQAEIDFYPTIVAINHQVVAEAFSSRVITPGVTTIDDLEFWVRERLAELKLDTWFPPMFYITRPAGAGPPTRVIQRGDLLRCDVGVTYLGLNSDIQEVAYVLREGETDAPKGLKDALAKGNRLQDILVSEMQAGRSGNAILASALQKAKTEGLVPRIYSHPIGYHGHAAGTRIGLPDMQNGVPGMGDYPLFADTCWAIELGVRVAIPEWGHQEIQMALEEDAVFTAKGTTFLDGRQTAIRIVR
jgi:Xaa-Pro aminopeptidase